MNGLEILAESAPQIIETIREAGKPYAVPVISAMLFVAAPLAAIGISVLDTIYGFSEPRQDYERPKPRL